MILKIGDRVKIVSDPHDGMMRFVGRVGTITAIDHEWYQVGTDTWSGWFRADDLGLVSDAQH